jgi:ABC-type antimicrobial peptide transport system permease subunit
VGEKVPTSAYFPVRMNGFYGTKEFVRSNVSYVIRSSRSGSESFLSEIRSVIWSSNPNLPLAEVRTLDQIYRKSMARTSFTLVLLMIAASMALLLGAVGMYGVIAYSVSQSTREIGIRMALGAQPGEVAGSFVRHGVLLAGIGAGFGLLSAFLLMRLLSTLLFSVSPADPLTYGAMLLLILVTAALASYLPSRRAAAIDPAVALRLD